MKIAYLYFKINTPNLHVFQPLQGLCAQFFPFFLGIFMLLKFTEEFSDKKVNFPFFNTD